MIAAEIARTILTRHRGRIAILMLVLVWGYFLVAFGEQAWRARELQANVDAQRTAITELSRENAELQIQADRYASDAYTDYAQGIARRDLGLAYPGETVLLVQWEGNAAPATPPDDSLQAQVDERPNWRRWIDLFSGE